MACCGRGRSTKPPVNTSKRETPPALATPTKAPPPAVPPRVIVPAPRPVIAQAPQQTPKAINIEKPVPQSKEATDALPKCKYREFKSKQIIGGREIETYYCKAFSMNVRQEHCRACQRHDK